MKESRIRPLELIERRVTVETSKLLKEAGFNMSCEYFYNEGSCYELQNDSLIRTGSGLVYEAPTQSLVQLWLRDIHQINIGMSFKPNIKKWDFITYPMALTGRQYVMYYSEYYRNNNNRRYDKYELALEDAIIESINLIKSNN